ncbi:MAG: hypothetical protein Q7S74_01750 [Nanoarchaeota archaeon]|nr:hypothetical protein [Nanoarchaeota archaeon]
MNRKAELGNQLMIIPFVFLLIIIGGGLFAGSAIYFGKPLNTQQTDATLLNYKLTKCIKQQPFDWQAGQDILDKEIYKKCQLDESVIKENFLILIKIDDEIKYTWRGDETKCALSDITNENYPKCATSDFIKKLDGSEAKITLITGSYQKSKKELT